MQNSQHATYERPIRPSGYMLTSFYVASDLSMHADYLNAVTLIRRSLFAAEGCSGYSNTGVAGPIYLDRRPLRVKMSLRFLVAKAFASTRTVSTCLSAHVKVSKLMLSTMK